MTTESREKSRLSVFVRPARDADADFIATVASSFFLVYGSYDRYLEEWFRTETVTTFVAEVRNRPAGFFMLAVYPQPGDPSASHVELLAIAVVRELQSQGIGSALLEEAIERSKLLASPTPIREVQLSVAETNARAQRLFAKRGFRFLGGEGIYPAGQRAIRMRLVLEPA